MLAASSLSIPESTLNSELPPITVLDQLSLSSLPSVAELTAVTATPLGLPAATSSLTMPTVPVVAGPAAVLPPVDATLSGAFNEAVMTLPVMAPPPTTPVGGTPVPSTFTVVSPAKKTIKLWSGQAEHIANLERALKLTHRAMDFSETGDGKTYTTCYMAEKHGLELFVVAPKTVCLEKWDIVPADYGIPITAFSYNKSSGGFDGLLTKHVVNKVVYFRATRKLESMFSSKTLLVFDEVHHLKNPGTVQLAACGELARVVIARGGYVIGLSYTPSEVPKHAPPVFKALGIMTRDKPYLYDYSTKEFIPDGILQIEAFAASLNASLLDAIKPPAVSRVNINKYVQAILNQIVFPAIRSRLIEPEGVKDPKNMKNLFMKLDEVNRASLCRLIEALEAMTEQRKAAGIAGANFGQVTTMLKQIEMYKAMLFIRATEHALSKPNTKVVVGLNFLDSMDLVGDHFNARGIMPLFLTGAYTSKERRDILSDFRTDASCRLLIVSPKVGGEGIDLHATDGITHIYQFLSPSYNHTELIQLAGRTHRKGQTSIPIIRIIYVDNRVGEHQVQRELEIMDSLNGKSTNMAEARGEKVEDCNFPGTLPIEDEAMFLVL